MNKFVCRISWFYALLMSLMVSCQSTVLTQRNPEHAPPGQIKKATGSQSAKPYAPGQQKKN